MATKLEEQGNAVTSALPFEVSALIPTTYFSSFNTPKDPRDIEFRIENRKHNSFDLGQADIFLSRLREDEMFGFKPGVDFGRIARGEAADWNGSGVIGDSSEEDNAVEVREAFLVDDTPLSIDGENTISLKGGEFVTLLGDEVLPEWGARNDNISRSMLFGYSIPFTRVGLLADFPICDVFSFDDLEGTRTGIDNRQTLWSITPTLAEHLTDHILARVEYRHDQGNKNYFPTDREEIFHAGNDTVTAQLSVGF